MTPAAVAALIRAAVVEVISARGITSDAVRAISIDDGTLLLPDDPLSSDYGSTIALRTAQLLNDDSRQFAADLIDVLLQNPAISAAKVTGLGFINFELTAAARGSIIATILAEGDNYGRNELSSAALAEALASKILRGRDGTRFTFTELSDFVGVDTARYAMLLLPSGSTIEMDSLRRYTDANPVFRVWYAHARLIALAHNAIALGFGDDPLHYDLLIDKPERALLQELAIFPLKTSKAEQTRRPELLCRYLDTLVETWQEFYQACRILPQGDEEITSVLTARLALCAATRQVISTGLDLLGISVPERI